MKFDNILNYFSKDIGVDLGTANSLVYLKNRGVVIAEPSVVAINNKTNKILAVGNEAKEMLGRSPSYINVVRPLTNGVISDFEMTQEILRFFLERLNKTDYALNYRRAIIGIPSNLTEVERKSVEDAVVGSGVHKVYLIDESVASAIGAGLPIESPTANMIVDIGGGTAEIAIISLGGTVTARSLKVAGDKMNDDILRFVRDEFRLAIGEPTAEAIKIGIGSAIPLNDKLEMTVRGRDMSSGLPREIIIKDHQVRAALAKSLHSISEVVREVIEVSPPELVGDILRHGIHLSGGGSLLKGMDRFIEEEIGVTTKLVDEPLTGVIRGIGAVVEDFPRYKNVLDNPLRPSSMNI